jgi:pimeloyl-ACP methyl ester carboxylesterase
MLISEIVQADPRAYRAAMLALARHNSFRRLKEINAPTLVITGAYDTTVDPAIQAQMVKLIPGARQVVIPEAGHAATADQPDKFNKILINFLSR